MIHLVSIPWPLLITAFSVAFIITLVSTPWINRLAHHWHWFDQPSPRRIHIQPTPRVGGIAIFLGFIIALLVTFGLDPRIYGVGLCGTLIFLLGLADDFYDLPPLFKLIAQIAIASLAVWFGITIGNITNPLGGTILLPPILDIALSIGWMLLLINTVNFLDGLDGLAVGVTAIASLVLVILSLFTIVNQPQTAALAAIVCGAALGFLYYNWYPAKIFMGDSGSHLLGLMLAILSIISGGKIATAALALGLPILDLIWAVIRRIKEGYLPWSADKLHLHHLLLSARLSQRATVMIFYLFTAGFGMVALFLSTWSKLIGFTVVALIMVVLIRLVVYFHLQHKTHS